MRDSGMLSSALGEAHTLLKAAQRVAALAIVDVEVAVPQAKPVCEVALRALRLETSKGDEFTTYRPSKCPSALLICCHPSEGSSLCKTLAQIWEEELRHAGVECTHLNLCSKEFEGACSLSNAAELRAALGSKADSTPAEVKRLQHLVEDHRFLIFVHPIFWFEVPSQLKGFLESVLSSGFAFRKLPSCWTLNRAVGVLERLPVLPSLLRRYSAYGMLRDKCVYITRTQGGPEAGLGIFGHGATSLESSLQFCGARIMAVDALAEVDDTKPDAFTEVVLPRMRRQIATRCSSISKAATDSYSGTMLWQRHE